MGEISKISKDFFWGDKHVLFLRIIFCVPALISILIASSPLQAILYIGFLGMSYAAAAVLYVTVEQPLMFIERMTYRR